MSFSFILIYAMQNINKYWLIWSKYTMWHVIGYYRVAFILFFDLTSHYFPLLKDGTKTYYFMMIIRFRVGILSFPESWLGLGFGSYKILFEVHIWLAPHLRVMGTDMASTWHYYGQIISKQVWGMTSYDLWLRWPLKIFQCVEEC